MSAERETYVRRRAFNRIHVNSWLIYLEKDGCVRCPFQNCNFMAFDVNEMCEHYGFCKGDSSFANFVCEVCKGCTVSEKKLQEHRARAHNITILPEKTDTSAEAEKSEPGKPSRVMILTWGVSFDKHKYIKCSNCQYLANTMSDMCRHYLVCKQEKKFLLYVCPECKGRSHDVARLIQHLEWAHKISKRPDQFNHISRNMVQFWEKELREVRYATCLHINSAKERDCQYIDVDVLGINEHSQTCKGPQQVSSSKQWFCQFCQKWTSSYEKLNRHHLLSHHTSPNSAAKVEITYQKIPPSGQLVKQEVLNNPQYSARSQQLNLAKTFLPIQCKNTKEPIKKLSESPPKPHPTFVVVNKHSEGKSKGAQNITGNKHVDDEPLQNKMRRESYSPITSPKNIFIDVDANVNEPETIVPDMSLEECPLTVYNSNQQNKEIFLDLVEDKLVARTSLYEFDEKCLENNISRKNVCSEQDCSSLNLETDIPNPNDCVTTRKTMEHLIYEEKELGVSNEVNKNEADIGRKNTIKHNEEEDFREKCVVNVTSNLENSISSVSSHDKSTLSHQDYDKKYSDDSSGIMHKVSQNVYPDETEVMGVMEKNVIEGKDRAKEDIFLINENNSKSNKIPCYVLFKDEPSSDEEDCSEKCEKDNVFLDIKKHSFDWHSENKYKSPKNYTRRKSSEDSLERCSSKKSPNSLCKTNQQEIDSIQCSVGFENSTRTSISCTDKKSYENHFKKQTLAKKELILQNKTHHYDESQEESSKNSEKNDKLMLEENSFAASNKINSKMCDQNQTLTSVANPNLRDDRSMLFKSSVDTKLDYVLDCEGDLKPTKCNYEPKSVDSAVYTKERLSGINKKSKLPIDTSNFEMVVQDVAIKDKVFTDRTEDNSQMGTEFNKQNLSVNSDGLKNYLSVEENKIVPSKPNVVYFFYSGKLKKPISDNESIDNKKKTENSKPVTRLEFLRNTGDTFSNTTNYSGNLVVVNESLKRNEELNSSQLFQIVDGTSLVQVNNDSSMENSNLKLGIAGQVQPVFNVDNTSDENITEDKISTSSVRSPTIVSKFGIKSECSYVKISSDIHSNLKMGESLQQSETDLESKLEDRRLSSDFCDKSSLDEEYFLGTDEELGMKDKFFNGFQEISDYVYSKNRRFRQILNRISESENEEWYINAGNLSLDVRKDLSLSHEKYKDSTMFEYDRIRSLNDVSEVVEDNNTEKEAHVITCKAFANDNVEISRSPLMAYPESASGDVNTPYTTKNDNILSNLKHQKTIQFKSIKQKDIVDNVTIKQLPWYSSAKQSSMKSHLKSITKQSLKISLSIDNLKIPSKPGIETINPQKYDKVNLYEPAEEYHVHGNNKVFGLNNELVEEDCFANQVIHDSYNHNSYPEEVDSELNETKNTNKKPLEPTLNFYSNQNDAIHENLKSDLTSSDFPFPKKIHHSPSEDEKNKLYNTAENKNKNESSSMTEIDILQKYNCKESTDGITNTDLTGKSIEDIPSLKNNSPSELILSNTECSSQVVTKVNSNFLGQSISSKLISPKLDTKIVEKLVVSIPIDCNPPELCEEKTNQKFKCEDITCSDEALSSVDKANHSSVKTVLCAKGNLLTEGFSPHDHIPENNSEAENMKNTTVHLDTTKPVIKTNQNYTTIMSSDVYVSGNVNLGNQVETLNFLPERDIDECKIKEAASETATIDVEKLDKTTLIGLNNQNITISDNFVTVVQGIPASYPDNLAKLDNHSTPKRRGRPPKKKLYEISVTPNEENQASNSFNEVDCCNELLISIYSEEVENILVDGLFDKNKDNCQYKKGPPEFLNKERRKHAAIESSKDVTPNQHDIQDKSAPGHSSDTNVPKKRGRKPKSKLEFNNSECLQSTPVTSKHDEILQEGKRNCKRVVRDSPADKQCNISEIEIPKKRGRPPKLKSQNSSSKFVHDAADQSLDYDNANTKKCKDVINYSNTEIACDISVTKVPKKRGRKPKLKLEHTNFESTPSDTTLSSIKHEFLDGEICSNNMVNESSTEKLVNDEIIKFHKKRGRPRKQKPEDLYNNDKSNLEDKNCRSSHLNKQTPRKNNSLTTTKIINSGDKDVQTDMDCDSSDTSELLGTDVIMINEEKLHSSPTSNKKSRKCKEKPLPKSVVSEDDQSDDYATNNSFSSDDSEDDISYTQPQKRKKMDVDTDGETGKKPGSNNARKIGGRKVGIAYFKIKHKSDDKVVCGACKKEMTYANYRSSHAIFKHYMLTWLEGEESPVDMNNKKDIECRLWFSKKRMRKTPFRCPVCNLPKLSAVGFYSHIQFCGKDSEEKESLLVTCEVCHSRMMPSSLRSHMKVKHSVKPQEKTLKEEVNQSLIVRGPRAAATRAVQVIQKSQADDQNLEEPGSRASSPDRTSQLAHLYIKPSKVVPPKVYRQWKDSLTSSQVVACEMEGCNFTATTTILCRKHYFTCPFKPPRLFKCRNCDFTSTEDEEMVEHVEKNHVDENFYQLQESDDESSEGSVDEEKPTRVNYCGSTVPFKFLRLLNTGKHPRHLLTKRFFTPAMIWTFQLQQRMFAKETLYPEEAHYQPLTAETVCTQLPELSESINFQGRDGSWQKLQRFHSCVLDGVAVLFAGGPVWATSWAPVPYSEENQYLAVSAHKSIDQTHKMSSLYNYPGLIQIWALGSLKNIPDEVSCPRLVVGLAQQRGPVWGLAWCPAGAYTQERLGLLAAACGDGSVVVYAIPRVSQSPSNPLSSCMSAKPLWELKLGCEMMVQCICVEWHSAAPHSIIAGGFANGMVALWDLTTTSPLLKSGSALLPFKVIEAHHSVVTSVKLSCTEGITYMMTASLDRTTKFWNLDDTKSPISFLRKACVTDAVMTNNWLMSISAYDDVYSINSSHVTGSTLRDFYTTANTNFVLQPGTVWSLSFNDWLNGCAYASEMGKVNAFFRQQLLVTEDSKKVNKSAFTEDLVTCTVHSTKDSSPVTKAFGPSYKDCASTCGLKFDFGGQSKGNKTPACNSENMNSFPIRSFNNVSWNQNINSFTWLAAGMQCGLVVVPRIRNLNPRDLAELDKLKNNL